MLYLTRKVGESVMLNEDVEVTVIAVRGKTVKLGFTFPPEVSVLRREIFERVQAENVAAAEANRELVDALPSRGGGGGESGAEGEDGPPPRRKSRAE